MPRRLGQQRSRTQRRYSVRTWLVLQSRGLKRGEDELALPKASQAGSRLHVIFGVANWSEGRPHPAFAPHPLLFAEPVAEPAHGFNCIASFPEFFAQAAYVRVHGTGIDYTLVTPNVVEQFIAVLHAPAALD